MKVILLSWSMLCHLLQAVCEAMILSAAEQVLPPLQPELDTARWSACSLVWSVCRGHINPNTNPAHNIIFWGLRQVYWWHEKYRPRKPKYFNRVHTGYEWNKYNQTHYDHDNPPPKVVQGYKFNIFYPDLIDKSVVSTQLSERHRPCTSPGHVLCALKGYAGSLAVIADEHIGCWHALY